MISPVPVFFLFFFFIFLSSDLSDWSPFSAFFLFFFCCPGSFDSRYRCATAGLMKLRNGRPVDYLHSVENTASHLPPKRITEWMYRWRWPWNRRRSTSANSRVCIRRSARFIGAMLVETLQFWTNLKKKKKKKKKRFHDDWRVPGFGSSLRYHFRLLNF